ncbi:MAG: stage V sporulation protein AC [Eubacteriales bacterium]
MKKQKNQPKINKEYNQLVQRMSPKPKLFKNCLWAFFVGGAICTIGQGINNYILSLGQNTEDAAAWTAIILVFLGALFTGLDLYDELGKYAGAGSVVPITGFANSVVSPAIEYKKEGYVFGVGAKIFTIAGPVILYGIFSSVIVGLVYYFYKLIG